MNITKDVLSEVMKQVKDPSHVLNLVPSKTLMYMSSFYVLNGKVIKAFSLPPENVTGVMLQHSIHSFDNVIVQEGNVIKAYFKGEMKEQLKKLFIPNEYTLHIMEVR